MEPERDLLDTLGRALLMGDLESVKADVVARVESLQLENPALSTDDARAEAAERVGALQWGPTKVPVFNVLLLASLIIPELRAAHLTLTRWLAAPRPGGAGVPVDGRDLSGTTALAHSISTKPALDEEFAQVLYDAGADINARNRYGAGPAHEFVMIWSADAAAGARACQALKWFLAHGGNMWVTDNDGVSPWQVVRNSQRARRIPAAVHLAEIMDVEHERRRAARGKCCEFCGRADAEKLLVCGRCKNARYCAPPARSCQKVGV